MTSTSPALDVEGPAAPPRSNGELVFAEPWEGRAFGLAMAMVGRGAIDYAAFRARLIARISAWERANPDGGDFRYYRCWLAALEDELADRGLVARGDLVARSAALAARPAGHDHDHGHGHDHDHGHGHG
jgi:nitrile hydratase accessory protein